MYALHTYFTYSRLVKLEQECSRWLFSLLDFQFTNDKTEAGRIGLTLRRTFPASLGSFQDLSMTAS